MTPETGLATGAAVALALGITVRVLASFRDNGRWHLIAGGLRVIAALLLAAALLTTARADGRWMPLDLQQAALGLALSTMVLTLALWGWTGVDGAAPPADMAVLALCLLGIAIWPGESLPTCAQQQMPFWLQWAFFLVGTSATTVAAAASLMLGLHSGPRLFGRGRPQCRIQLSDFSNMAVVLALVFLGGGLVTSGVWAWRSTGSLVSDDPRISWMAAAWLMAASTRVAWRLKGRKRFWAAGLSVSAAIVGNLAFLALPGLARLLAA